MTVVGGSGNFTVELESHGGFKGDVTVDFSYDDSPVPVPMIEPPSVSLYVPCNGSVSRLVSVDPPAGWTLEVDASGEGQDESVSLPL